MSVIEKPEKPRSKKKIPKTPNQTAKISLGLIHQASPHFSSGPLFSCHILNSSHIRSSGSADLTLKTHMESQSKNDPYRGFSPCPSRSNYYSPHTRTMHRLKVVRRMLVIFA